MPWEVLVAWAEHPSTLVAKCMKPDPWLSPLSTDSAQKVSLLRLLLSEGDSQRCIQERTEKGTCPGKLQDPRASSSHSGNQCSSYQHVSIKRLLAWEEMEMRQTQGI